MKHLLFISLVLVCLITRAQEIDKTDLNKQMDSANKTSLMAGKMPASNNIFLINHGTVNRPADRILFYGKEIKSDAFRIDSSGNILYRPSAFCKCDTSTTLKFLFNIFDPNKKQP